MHVVTRETMSAQGTVRAPQGSNNPPNTLVSKVWKTWWTFRKFLFFFCSGGEGGVRGAGRGGWFGFLLKILGRAGGPGGGGSGGSLRRIGEFPGGEGLIFFCGTETSTKKGHGGKGLATNRSQTKAKQVPSRIVSRFS